MQEEKTFSQLGKDYFRGAGAPYETTEDFGGQYEGSAGTRD
jgi:hypothetical protein